MRSTRMCSLIPPPDWKTTLSDYVGRINLTPADWLDLRYRFRLDKNDLTYVRNEVEMVTGPPRVRFDLGYLMLEDDPALQSLREREEIRGGVSLQRVGFAFAEARDPVRLGGRS